MLNKYHLAMWWFIEWHCNVLPFCALMLWFLKLKMLNPDDLIEYNEEQGTFEHSVSSSVLK